MSSEINTRTIPCSMSSEINTRTICFQRPVPSVVKSTHEPYPVPSLVKSINTRTIRFQRPVPSLVKLFLSIQEHLGLVVLGLLRQGKFHFLAALRENLLSFLKAKVKGIVSGYLQGKTSSEEEPASLAECMRGMEFDAWLDMLSEVFDRMLQCQSAVQVCNSTSHPSSPSSPRILCRAVCLPM